MKSIASKKKNSTLIKKYAGIYLILFVAVLLFFFEHFRESPLNVNELQSEKSIDHEKAEVGYLAPGFKLRNLQGNLSSLDHYKGKVVILNFWATWCAPCRVEMPSFEVLYRRYRSAGLTVLAVSLDKKAEDKVKAFVEEYGLSFPVLLDSDGEVERLYPAFTIPFTFVIDQAGRVVARVDGVKNWESEETFEAIEFLLNKT